MVVQQAGCRYRQVIFEFGEDGELAGAGEAVEDEEFAGWRGLR